VNIQFKSSEVLILLAAAVMSLLANLPDSMSGDIIDKKILLIGLGGMIVVAMFRYLQVFLLLVITILAIGANLPAELASRFGISQTVMLVSLVALISVALLNRFVRFLPTGMKTSSGEIVDERETLLAAIAKGDQLTVHRMLVMNTNPNFTWNGTTPLHVAAEKGYPDIVQLLIKFGADYRKKNADGLTALEIALAKKKFIQTTEILHSASRTSSPDFGQNETRRFEAEMWQKQHGR
jgi:hypothetical protein